MVNLSGSHLVPLFCDHTGSTPLSEMALVALATAAMVHPDLHHCCMALLQHILPLLNNPYNDFSLPLSQGKTTDSMVATPKMLMRTLHHRKPLLSYLLMTHMPTGMNIDSRGS